MALLAAWVAYPIILALLAYGSGTLVQLAAGRPLALGVRLPCGVALIIAVLDLFTRTTATASLAVAAAVVLGVIGLAVAVITRVRAGGRASWPRPPAEVPAAVGVFALYAAPVVLSGEATWAGFFKLDDTANWLAVVNRALSQGRNLAGVPPSAYQAVLENYLVTGYPLGSFLPLGLGHTLLGQDVAWLTDSWMAFMAAMLALALGHGARRALPRAPNWQPALIGALAAMSALLYGYYLWGGMKEMADAFLIATFAVSVPLALEGRARVRAAIPALVTLWALIAAESPGGLVWVGPGLLVALGLLALRRRIMSAGAPPVEAAAPAQAAAPGQTPASGKAKAKASAKAKTTAKPSKPVAAARGRRGPTPSVAATRRRKTSGARSATSRRPRSRGPGRWRVSLDAARARMAGLPAPREWLTDTSPTQRLVLAAVVLAVGGLVLVLRPGGWVRTFHAVITAGGSVGLGELAQPLNPLQLVGIWPSGDFRVAASPLGLVYVLIAVAVIGAVVGLVMSVRQRRLEVILYLACALTGAWLVEAFASPWLAAKALAAASPAIPFAALLGAVWIAGRRRAAGLVLVVVVVGGVLWSDALGYHDVWLAPRAQLAELVQVNQRIAGHGPTLVPDPEVLAVRYFLRDGAPESPGELRSRTDPLVNGQTLPTGGYADLDQLSLGAVLQYPTIVLHRSPVNSRPPYGYNLTYEGHYWQVWQRSTTAKSPIVNYAPLGGVVAPGGVPVCSALHTLALAPGVHRVVAAPVTNPIIVGTASGTQPASWTDPAGGGHYSQLSGPGTARFPVTVPAAGRYQVWLGGSIRDLTRISVDGRLVGSVRNDIQRNGQYVEFGTVNLSAGTHSVSLQRPGGQLLAPGSGGPPDVVGPLALAPDVPPPPLLSVAPSAVGTLCGRTLDWVEGLSS